MGIFQLKVFMTSTLATPSVESLGSVPPFYKETRDPGSAIGDFEFTVGFMGEIIGRLEFCTPNFASFNIFHFRKTK